MKINKWLMAFCAVILAPLMFVGCGENNSTYIWVGWVEVAEGAEEATIALNSGRSYQLEYTVMPVEATNKSVSFSSSDTSIATVDKNGLVTPVAVGSAIITISSNDNSQARKATVTINVLAEMERLSVPTGLHYDSVNKKVVWNSVVTTTNFKPSYVVKLDIDGNISQTTTASPSIDVTEFNKRYTVTVLAQGNNVMYASSAETQPLSFVQLGKPSDVELVASNDVNEAEREYYFKFAKQPFTNGIEDYTIDISTTNGTNLSSSEREDWANALLPENVKIEDGYIYVKVPEKITSSQLKFTVKANGSAEDGIYASAVSDTIKFAQLSAPSNLSLSQTANTKLLTWSTVPNASKYKILIKYAMKDNTEEQRLVVVDSNSATPTTFDFANLADKPNEADYNSFDIYMYALGADTPVFGVRYLDSTISDLPAKQQLTATQKILITKNTTDQQYEISWSEVANAVSYKVYICPENANGTIDEDITEKDLLVYVGPSISCTIGFNQTITVNGQEKLIWTAGRNYLKVVACPESESKYLESVPKLHDESFIKLSRPENFRVEQGVLRWDAVSGASLYKIDFGNGATVLPTVEVIEGQKVYTYEPTVQDMESTTRTYYVSVVAVNDDVALCIDSELTDRIDVTRYGRPTNLRVEDGSLKWDMIDELGKLINADTVEIKITNINGEEVTPVFTAQSVVGIEKVLEQLNLDNRYFNLQVRAVNTKVNNQGDYNFVNGEWTNSISTYQLPTPQNVRLDNGLISWQSFEDSNIDPNHTGIRFELQIGSQSYGVKSDPILDINSTSAVISGLTPNSITYKVKLRAVIDASKAGDFGITTQNSSDVYIINSNYSKEFNVKQLSSPSDMFIQESTLYWGASSQSLNAYRVELYKLEKNSAGVRTRAETPTLSEIVRPSDPSNPKFDFSVLNIKDQYDFNAGAYQFVVFALGTSYDSSSTENCGYLTSYHSNYVEIYKLATPKLDVAGGYVTWNPVYSELGGVQQRVSDYLITVEYNANTGRKSYSVKISGDLATNFNKQTIPSEFWGVQLFISIRAVSSWQRVFDSELSEPYAKPTDVAPESNSWVVQKQTKVQTDVSHIRIEGINLIWTDALANNKQFLVEFHSMNTANYPLVDSKTLDENKYELPNVAGGKYYLTIMRKGYERYAGDTVEQGGSRFLDSEPSDKILIERFDQPLGITMQRDSDNNPILGWSVTQADSHMRYKINITHTATDSAVTEYTYYMPYSARSLNLYGKAYDENDNEVSIAEFGAGSLRITIQSIRSRQQNAEGNWVDVAYYTDAGNNLIYLMDSAESSAYNAYIYDAPLVRFENGIIKIVKSNQFDKGVQLIFTPIEDNALVEEGAVKVSLATGVDEYDMKIDNKLAQGVKYQVKLRALGNSNNIIASVWKNGDYVVERLEPLNANTVNASLDNTSNYDGWYVRNGDIEWGRVEGASQYIAYITNAQGNEMVAFSVDNDDTINTYTGKIDSVDYGAYKLRFKLVGGETDNTITLSDGSVYKLGYVSSDLSTEQEIIKLYAPNNYQASGRGEAYSRMKNGEFDWGLRDGNDKWVDTVGITAYRINIGDKNTVEIATNFVALEGQTGNYPQGVDTTAQYFDAKEYLQENKGQFIIKIYSVGNNWRGSFETNKIYITSDAYGDFTLNNGGVIDDLVIKEGKLQWSPVANGSENGYEIVYEVDGNVQSKVISYKSSNYSFDAVDEVKGKTINKIMVRHAGDSVTQKGAMSGYINTIWSAELNNIIKLPDIEKTSSISGSQKDLCINNYGQLAWTYGEQYLTGSYSNADLKMHLWLDIDYLNVTVGGYRAGWNVDKPNSTFDVPTIDVSEEQIRQAFPNETVEMNGILKYKIYGYVMGTQEEVPTSEATGYYYLNSDTYSHDAYKIGNPTAFNLDKINGPGLRLNWDLSECSVTGYDPSNNVQDTVTINGDVILFSYYKEDDTTLYRKLVTIDPTKDLISQIPLWEVAYFDEIRLTVLNSEGSAFASSTLSVTNVEFGYFDSGEGTRENPFVIKDNSVYTAEQQLGLIYWLPELYFELGQDITLSDLSVIRNTNSSATSNFPVPTTINSAMVADIYKKLELTGGIYGNGYTISNVTINQATSFGWWTSILGGKATETIENDKFLNKTGIIRNLNIRVYEIDVTQLGQGLAENDFSYNGVFAQGNYGYIVDCGLDGATINERHDANNNYIPVIQGKVSKGNVYIGGFAGVVGVKLEVTENNGGVYVGNGTIENCTNLLDLSLESIDNEAYSSYTGGIAGKNYAGMIINSKNGSADLRNNNSATITGYYAGGIVAILSGYTYFTDPNNENTQVQVYPYVVGCVNYGKVISNLLLNTADIVYSAGGGIVGLIDKGFVTYSINYGEVTTEGRGAALGGIVGSQGSGAYTLNNINLGKITFDEYYNYTSTTTAVKAGSLIGHIDDGNLWNSWSIKDCIFRNNKDGTQTIGDSTYGSQETGTINYVDTVSAFTTLSESELLNIFNEDESGINATVLFINGNNIATIYEKLDGTAPKFECNVKGNPYIVWEIRIVSGN